MAQIGRRIFSFLPPLLLYGSAVTCQDYADTLACDTSLFSSSYDLQFSFN